MGVFEQVWNVGALILLTDANFSLVGEQRFLVWIVNQRVKEDVVLLHVQSQIFRFCQDTDCTFASDKRRVHCLDLPRQKELKTSKVTLQKKSIRLKNLSMRQLVLFYVGKLFVCDHVLGQVIRVFVRQVR